MGVPFDKAVATYQTYPPANYDAIREGLEKFEGLEILPYRINWHGFIDYLNAAQYPQSYRDTFKHLYIEKALEHYISADILGFGSKDVFIDIASCSSPFAEIVSRLYGCTVYQQDLDFPPGINGQIVGGSAGELPFPDSSISRMTLHCSLEHFEGEADSQFIGESARVLSPGGGVCILPLYLADEFVNLTDPGVGRDGLIFDDGAKVAEVAGWTNRFGRYYNLAAFTERVFKKRGSLKARLYIVENTKELFDFCYVKFALVLSRV